MSEINILARCILDTALIDNLVELGLREEHFSQGRYKALWRVMSLGLGVDKDRPFLNAPAAFMGLPEASRKEWGDPGAIVNLTNDASVGPTGEIAKFDAKQLIETARKNKALAALKSTYIQIEKESNWQKCLAEMEIVLASLNRDEGPTLKQAGELMTPILYPPEEANAVIVKSGIPSFDRQFKKIEGRVIYIGARPSVGKSAVMQQIALETAAAGTGVVVFSIEMTEKENGVRLVQQVAKINSEKVQEMNLTEAECKRAFEAHEKVSSIPLFIETSKKKTFEEILGDIRRLKRTKNIAVAMVDYVQLINSSARSFSRREELADICQEIQIFAKDTGVTMFILAQLNRDIKNGDGKPALIHFKDTGQIEQSADIAILLSKINDDPRRMLADFAKVRFGRTEEVYLDVEPETLTYKEGSKPETQPQSNRSFDDFDDKMWK